MGTKPRSRPDTDCPCQTKIATQIDLLAFPAGIASRPKKHRDRAGAVFLGLLRRKIALAKSLGQPDAFATRAVLGDIQHCLAMNRARELREAIREAEDLVVGLNASSANGEGPAKGRGRATINARMEKRVSEDPLSEEWTTEQWRKFLGTKSTSGICKTLMWKVLSKKKEQNRIQREARKLENLKQSLPRRR